jgi:F0F1-type ATP synthase epsilon subunit
LLNLKNKDKIIKMFYMNLQVCIMTPDEIFNEQAVEIILPTNTGQMGVLTNHAPIITALLCQSVQTKIGHQYLWGLCSC